MEMSWSSSDNLLFLHLTLNAYILHRNGNRIQTFSIQLDMVKANVYKKKIGSNCEIRVSLLKDFCCSATLRFLVIFCPGFLRRIG